MVIDPWGSVIARRAGDEESEGIVVADLDLAELTRIRSVLPSLANRVPDAYRWPD